MAKVRLIALLHLIYHVGVEKRLDRGRERIGTWLVSAGRKGVRIADVDRVCARRLRIGFDRDQEVGLQSAVDPFVSVERVDFFSSGDSPFDTSTGGERRILPLDAVQPREGPRPHVLVAVQQLVGRLAVGQRAVDEHEHLAGELPLIDRREVKIRRVFLHALEGSEEQRVSSQ